MKQTLVAAAVQEATFIAKKDEELTAEATSAARQMASTST
jgi:hypothetical protein